jgi:hypothetical protein
MDQSIGPQPPPTLDVLATAYHPGYHLIRFKDSVYGGVKLAIVFRARGNYAILDLKQA